MPKIKRPDQQDEIELTAIDEIPISDGTSPKSFLSDGMNRYIFKKPKKRSFETIFKENFPSNLNRYKNWTIDKFYKENNKENIDPKHIKLLEPYVIHLKDLLFEAAFGEVLYQRIGKKLFRSFEATETYLHIDSVTEEPGIITQMCNGFNEFIEKKLELIVKQKISSPKEWNNQIIPNQKDLDFSSAEYYLLGKLYAISLITNDWDLVNNIMLSNAGCLGETSTATKVMVVDGGNKFHFGFDGLTCDETVFQNSFFNSFSESTQLIQTSNDSKFIKSTDPENHPITGYLHTLPFDEEVSFDLPRLIIPDLFSLDNPYLFKGFKDLINEAKTTLITNPYCIQQAIKEAKECYITLDSHQPTIERFNNPHSTLINHSYYFSIKESDYTLGAILKSRCQFLSIACMKMENEQISAQEINLHVLNNYKNAQFKQRPDYLTSKSNLSIEAQCSLPIINESSIQEIRP